jgi:hypothetical protein
VQPQVDEAGCGHGHFIRRRGIGLLQFYPLRQANFARDSALPLTPLPSDAPPAAR